MGRKTIEITVPHSFDFEEAKERVQALGDYFANKYGATVFWKGDTAYVKGAYMVVRLDVAVEVLARSVRLETRDPGRLLRRRMSSYAERKLLTYLDANTRPADLPRT